MICSGPNGTLFEVTPQKELVWKYVNPVKGGFGPGGPGGPGGPPRPNQVLAPFMQDMLGLSSDQKKGLDTLQKTVDVTLEEVLTDQQKKSVRERGAPGPGAMGAMPVPGQIMSVATQLMLKPTSEQKTRLSDLQKDVDAKLDKLLTEDQRKQFKQMRADFARGGPGGPPGGGPPPALFAGPPGGGGVFRAYRYGPEYAGLAGKELKPGKTVEELDAKEAAKAKDATKAKDSEKQ
jgi:Spy/CpxP family protein refolding chaperone